MNVRMTGAAWLLVGAALALAVAPVQGGQTADVSAMEAQQGRHAYTYYPAHRIYHDAERDLWFWYDEQKWQSGARLPAHLQQFTTGGVDVHLDTLKPHERQAWIEQRYGKPIPYEKTAEYRAVQRERMRAQR